MSTRVERFRDHCRKMATAEHKSECPMLTAVEPYWPPGGWVPVTEDGEWDFECKGVPAGLGWLGPKPKWERPRCDGCVSDADRALFAQLADEAEAYAQGDLLEDA